MLEFIMKYWVEVAFTIITSGIGLGYRRLILRIQENSRKQEAVEEGIQALLRDRIIQAYTGCMDKGYCPIYAMEDINALYAQYHALGGNGMVTGLLEKIKELPTEKES